MLDWMSNFRAVSFLLVVTHGIAAPSQNASVGRFTTAVCQTKIKCFPCLETVSELNWQEVSS